MADDHGIRISYGADPNDHSTYVVYVPLEPGDFPEQFGVAVKRASVMLMDSVSKAMLPGQIPSGDRS